MPARASRATVVVGEDAAFADQRCRSSGTSRRQPLGRREVDLEGAQVAVVDADQRRASSASARSSLGLVMHLDQHVHAELERGVLEVARPSSSSTAAMMIRMQSAPQARAS